MRLSDFTEINPYEKLPKGTIAKKISMEQLEPYEKFVSGYSLEAYSGGAKFRNGDTIMARITPCLENGKTAFVSTLDKNEVGFGSTEYIVFRAKDGISHPDFVYYLVISSLVREPAIKSMVGSSGRQRVQQTVIDELEVPNYSLAEQQHIVDILGSIDEKIEKLEKENKEFQKLCLSQFKLYFNNKEKVALNKLATVTMGQSPDGNTINESSGTIFYQGRTDFGFRYPKVRLYTSAPKRMAKEDDILLSVRAPVGDVNVAMGNCCIGRGLAAISSNYKHFVFYSLLAQQSDFDVYNNTGTIFGSITREALLSFAVPASDMIDVVKFDSLAATIDSKIKQNVIESIKLKEIKALYLQKFFG